MAAEALDASAGARAPAAADRDYLPHGDPDTKRGPRGTSSRFRGVTRHRCARACAAGGRGRDTHARPAEPLRASATCPTCPTLPLLSHMAGAQAHAALGGAHLGCQEAGLPGRLRQRGPRRCRARALPRTPRHACPALCCSTHRTSVVAQMRGCWPSDVAALGSAAMRIPGLHAARSKCRCGEAPSVCDAAALLEQASLTTGNQGSPPLGRPAAGLQSSALCRPERARALRARRTA